MATIRTFRYGTFAARVKFQRNAGQHGSFWLQSTLGPGTGAPKTAGAEVDIVEFFGAKPDKRLASFIYYYPAPGAEAIKEGAFIPQARSFLTGEDDDWWKNYHVFALHWTPQRYTILIDGRPAWSTGKGVSQHEEMMVLSLLSSDYELPLLDGELPQTMKVDWVKHWASD
jgi:beta-glucanase (GH16 family)